MLSELRIYNRAISSNEVAALYQMESTPPAPPVTTDTFGTGTNQFTIDFVGIGNPGNPNDTTGYGGVPYEYRIGKYTISQNQIDAATRSGLQNVSAGAWSGDKPAANISWYEAAAYVNWLNTSKGYAPAYNVTFTNGAWSMALWPTTPDANGNVAWTSGGTNLYRNANCAYFLPSENEWYKAAYYDPNKNGGSGGYWLYPTGSDSAPTPVASGTAAGTAVYYGQFGPASVFQTGGLSPYGTMGQGGNVIQWEESPGIYGCAWVGGSISMMSLETRPSVYEPGAEEIAFGFRVASTSKPDLSPTPTPTPTPSPITAGTTDTFGTGTNQFTIDFVGIGNPGNSNDTTGYGGVPYEYRIGKYTISQNQVDAATRSGLQNVTSGPWSGDQPAANISWYEAAAYVNWLNTSQGYAPAYNLTYNNGSWSMGLWPTTPDGNGNVAWTSGGTNLYRNANCAYFLPSENEWYKAAYYDPVKNGGSGGYWLYPTGSDNAPSPVASGTAAGTAVFDQPWENGPASVFQTGGLSPYGTMGQGGNVWQWKESAWYGNNDVSQDFYGILGGIWAIPSDSLQSSFRCYSGGILTGTGDTNGFRVASKPDPTPPVWVTSSDSNGVTIIGYHGTNATVVIPPTFDGLLVTSIGSWAFQNASNVTSITIPEGVTSIGSGAFAGIGGLTTITIPDSVVNMGMNLFTGSTNLTSMITSDGLRTFMAQYASDLGLSQTAIQNFGTATQNQLYAQITGRLLTDASFLSSLASSLGSVGPKGEKGDKGDRGEKGDQGDPGVAGPQGMQGEAGPMGPVGPAGQQGSQGEVGPIGPQGPVGPVGPAGEIGLQGIAGPQGMQGEAGPMGPVGPTGPKGDQGEAGPQGAVGPQGLQGISGLPNFGGYEQITNGTVYRAASDGFIMNNVGSGTRGQKGYVSIGQDSNNLNITFSSESGYYTGTTTATTPVPSGYYYQVSGVSTAYWVPVVKGALANSFGSLISGGGAPASDQGTIGDLYFDTNSSSLYGPKTSNGWTAHISVIGTKGDKGDPGIVGVAGVQGPVGPEGPVGPAGEVGMQGIAGPQGMQGEAGPMGPVGPAGHQGSQGEVGPIGPVGPQGLPGEQGLQGLKGEQGEVGETGPAGSQGLQGEKGDRGEVGPQGLQGPQGIAGPAGADGAVGPQGVQGSQGLKGDAGLTGPAGPQGYKGEKGDIGLTGPQGLQGEKGDKGDPGIAGVAGVQGPVGPEGPVGPAGEVGMQGIAGPQGMQGEAGPMGPVGPAGQQGSQGEVGPIGPVGPQGLPGEQGLQGLKGDKGEKGDIGQSGPQGLQGEKGDKGDPGIAGVAGVQGLQGPVGPQGPQGVPGAQGPQGEHGLVDYTYFTNATFLNAIASNPAVLSALVGQSSSFLTNPALASALAAQISTNPSIANLMVKAPQTLTFPAFKVQTLKGQPITLTLKVTSSAKLTPIAFTSGNDAIAAVSGTTLTVNGAGTTTITATQAGSTNVSPATAIQTLVVNKGVQTIRLSAIPVQTYLSGKTVTLNATSSAGLPITYSVGNTGVAIVSTNVLTLQGTGTTTVTATQEGNDYFLPATATQTLYVK